MATEPSPAGRPRPVSRDARIAVVGAGPAGLHVAARLIERGYRRVEVFEASDRIGGKCRSVRPTDVLHELGACYLGPQYTAVRDLLDELAQEGHPGRAALRTLGPHQRLVADRHGSVPSHDWEHWMYARLAEQLPRPLRPAAGLLSRLRLLVALARYLALRRRLFGPDGTGLPAVPDDHTLDALCTSFGDFLRNHRLEALLPLLTLAQASQGYGTLGRCPAYYGLLWNEPALILGVLRAAIDRRAPFTQMLDVGYESLWPALARKAGLTVHLQHRLEAVERPAAGPHRLRFATADGATRVVEADATVSAIPYPDFVGRLADPGATETELAPHTQRCRFRQSLVRVDDNPFADRPITNYADYLGADLCGEVYGIRASAACLSPGERRQGDRELLLFQWAWDFEASTAAGFDQHLAEALPRLGLGGARILDQCDWAYFPRFTTDGLRRRAPWRVDAAQGEHRTWYVGGSVAFESIEAILRHSHRLLDRHFPEAS